MKGLVVVIRIWLVRVGFGLGRRLPLRRRVLLATSHADHLGGNLTFIHAELRRRRPEVSVAVLAHRAAEGWRGRLGGALGALRAGYHLARARLVVIDDYYFPLYASRPRRGTTVVQTWHASGAFKKIGYSVLDRAFGADEALTSRVQIHANYDMCLVGSQTATPHYAGAFEQPPERFVSRLGIPRTDLFFDADTIARTSANIRRHYGLPSDRRVVLYAPTFRGERVTRARHSEELDLVEMMRELGDGFILLVRLHPFVRGRTRIGAELAGFAFDVSDHPDINELMLISDVLITDYSSAIFEYSLLERPMAFFAPDLDAYERERGFYFDYRSGVPGPVFTETRALGRWLREGPVDLERVRRFRDASFEVADGRASQRFVENIVLPALDG